MARHRLSPLLTLLTLVVACALPACAVAASGGYRAVLETYRATGTIPPCRFTSEQLQSAQKDIDTYGAEYFADFAAAIQTALTQRASGVCGSQARAVPGVPGVSSQPSSRLPSRLPPVSAGTSAGLPLPLLVLAILAGGGALAAAAAGVWRWRGWEPVWILAWRHCWAEAAHRLGAVWLDFTDWVRSAS
jgi:hypothetical protein